MANHITFSLPKSINISSEAKLHQELEGVLNHDDHDGITLSAADVHKTDTAGMQLLLLFINEAKNSKLNVKWHQPSSSLCNAARLLGIRDTLGIQ